MTFSQLDKPVRFLKGVGPRRGRALAGMGINTARDLLYHVPRRYDDASTVQPIDSLEVGADATAVGRVRSKGVIPTRSGLRIFQAVLQDDTGMITCAWPGQPWLDRKLEEGDRLLVTGPVRFFHGRQLQPREFTVLSRARHEEEEAGGGGGREGGGREGDGREGDGRDTEHREGGGQERGDDGARDPGTIFVVYPAGEDVPQWVLRRIFAENLPWLLEQVASEEYLSPEERAELGVPGLPEAFRALHDPHDMAEVERARVRLAWDELFFLQLAQARVRWEETLARPGIRHHRTNELIRPLHEALPFSLTEAQTRVLRDIYDDMTSPRRMNRLLQGDVGSGKTVVALFAMLLAVEAGYQAALMAPTEILAEQHARSLREMAEPLGITPTLLTGRLSAPERAEALEAMGSGEASLIVGTHALIQEGVEFRRLGLVVVDEQHRFGVRQRMALGEQDTRPDVLVMSATPIPRSLALTLYGHLDVSVLDELPPGRQTITTALRRPGARPQVYDFVREEVEKGRQAYIVYPLVEESEKVELLSATREFERLSDEVFPELRLGLLHGQLPGDEKDRVMRSLRDGEIDVLIATSVIEVGIDVPNATVMIIEHAERFGLSQLHQLRGRVGRGGESSYCVLVADPGEGAEERLKIFRDTSDGFEVARADLRIRGPGDLFGDQQHGKVPALRFADLTRDEGILVEAQQRARERVEADPRLESEENRRIRALLDQRFGERLKMYHVG